MFQWKAPPSSAASVACLAAVCAAHSSCSSCGTGEAVIFKGKIINFHNGSKLKCT